MVPSTTTTINRHFSASLPLRSYETILERNIPTRLIHTLDYLPAPLLHVDIMKLLYIAALLVSTVLAADMGIRDRQSVHGRLVREKRQREQTIGSKLTACAKKIVHKLVKAKRPTQPKRKKVVVPSCLLAWRGQMAAQKCKTKEAEIMRLCAVFRVFAST